MKTYTRALAIVAAVIVIVGPGCRNETPVTPQGAPVMQQAGLQIAPIEGLTTVWHRAPDRSAIPLGTRIELRYPTSEAGAVTWKGAVASGMKAGYDHAVCPMDAPGEVVVEVQVLDQHGDLRTERCVFNVVDIKASDIGVANVVAEVDEFPFSNEHRRGKDEPDINRTTVNERTMEYYFRSESIARLSEIGPNHYATSTNRTVVLSVQAQPAEFTPLMEWRSPDGVMGLGGETFVTTEGQNVYDISVGPIGDAEAVKIETYIVDISSDLAHGEGIADGHTVTFTATTFPPGFEEHVTWLASTKYGLGDPVTGTGGTFQTTFSRSWIFEYDQAVQWLGVRGDNVIYNQDAKCPAAVSTASACDVQAWRCATWSFVHVVGCTPSSTIAVFQSPGPGLPATENVGSITTNASGEGWLCLSNASVFQLFTGRTVSFDGVTDTVVPGSGFCSCTFPLLSC